MAKDKKAAKELTMEEKLAQALVPVEEQPYRGCGRFLGPELSNSKTASILHRTQTP